ncbi:hypothetical protein [Micromonospora endolithica]|uniref:hypothetical protein n=1 Tax=Micromonospora endolithica TaxID=230091 RepID=UPI0011ADB5FF|nr:hypothetical protein [Micromonospora endolithica]TWJ24786.1 hypothetical protein JD76_04942 [Micromonospora endolithica]
MADAKNALGWGIGLLVLAGVVVGISVTGNDGDGTAVLPPTATQRTDTVPILRSAFESQGVCYGWRLTRGYGGDPISVGSNLGDGIPAAEDPRCPRWVEVVGRVTYTLESSEADDRATVDVDGSADFPATDLILIERGLERFDLAPDAFVDDPGWAVTRAAVTLPLLVAERGRAEFAPVATAAPAAPPAPLADAGSDLWRDRRGWLIGAAVLLLITALLVTVGLVQRRRQRAAPPAVPVHRAGKDPSRRTPERA